MDKRKLINVVRNLDELELSSKEKRTLIEECYGPLGRFYSFDRNLDNSLPLAKERNLKGKEAYDFLEASTGKYGIVDLKFPEQKTR